MSYKMIGKSKYKYVNKIGYNGKEVWRGTFFSQSGKGSGKNFETERQAAIYVDKQMIINGREPVNILVRK